jgi:hypothetical protein
VLEVFEVGGQRAGLVVNEDGNEWPGPHFADEALVCVEP